MNLSRLVVLGGSLVLMTHSPARAAEAQPSSSPEKRTVVLVRVDALPDLQPSYAKRILQQELARYQYSVLGCLDDLADENEMLKSLFDRGIRSETDSPRYTSLLKEMTRAGCRSAVSATLFAARIIAQNDQQAGQRSVVLVLRNLTHPEDPLLSSTINASFNTAYDELIRRVVDDVLGPKPPPRPPRSKRTIAGTAALLVGAGGVAAGAITGAILLAKKSQLDGGDCASGVCGRAEYGGVDWYNSLRIVSTTAFIVGGVGLVAGAILLKVGRAAGPDVQVAIVPEPTGGSATVLGRF